MPGEAPPVPALERPRTLAVLLLAALVLFTARIDGLSLPSLEDAFYGREAMEMARSGRIYTVTWNGLPTHQHPPLHLWLVARAFDALGERDLAARLPTVLLALGTLLAHLPHRRAHARARRPPSPASRAFSRRRSSSTTRAAS